MLHRVARRGAAVGELEPAKNLAEMRMHRAPAEKELVGDLRVSQPPRQQAQHLDLAPRQLIDPNRAATPRRGRLLVDIQFSPTLSVDRLLAFRPESPRT